MDPARIPSILIVDQSPEVRDVVAVLCGAMNYTAETEENGEIALRLYEEHRHDLVITGYKMEPIDGIELAKRIRQIQPEAVCLLMTSVVDHRTQSHEAMSVFFDLIPKPLVVTELSELIQVALGQKRGASTKLSPIAMSNRMDECLSLLGDSPSIGIVRRELSEMIYLKQPILISGPYGIGKPDVAKFIHEYGPFSKSHFVECHCNELDQAQLSEQLIDLEGQLGSLIEQSRNGTLVLHYVESLSLAMQGRLADRFKEISQKIHVICLTDTSLDEALAQGTIDDNLYFEISLCELKIPGLKERPQDVEAIVRYIALHYERYDIPRSFSRQEVDLIVAELRRIDLPRNVVELLERVRAYAL